jgi:hypothetical protein
MTKASPNKALESFINTNHLRVRVEGWSRETRRYGNSRQFDKLQDSETYIAMAVVSEED